MSALPGQKERVRTHTELLFNKFGKLVLDAKETAEVLNITEKMLENNRLAGTGLPYTRLSGNQRSKPLYSITAIAEEIIKREVKTFNH